MESTQSFVRDLVVSGIEPKNINLIYVEEYNSSKPSPSFTFSETILFDDFEHLIKLTKKNNIELANIAFINIKHPKFKIGNIDIMSLGREAASSVAKDDINAVIRNKSFESLFEKINFSPTPINELNKRLLDKATALNNKGGKIRGLESKKIVEYLINIEYDNSRIYSELARAYGRIYNYNSTALKKRKTVLNLALSIYPNDQWAHALLIFDETNVGNYASAEKHAVLATKHEKDKNIWTIVNWGRLYEEQGRIDDAKIKYKDLLGQRDLNDSNIIAHKRGLKYYADLLESTGDKGVSNVYRELIYSYPNTEACTKVKLAHNIVINSKDYSEAESLLNDYSVTSCENVNSTGALIDLREWYKSGATSALQHIIVKHGDLTTLIYEVASMSDANEVLQLFNKNNIDVSVTNQNGLNALHLSVASNNEKAIVNMLNAKIDVNSLLPNGWTPLMIATYLNSPVVVELLLMNGADKSLKTPEGYSALNIAKQVDFKKVIELLESTSL